jgi:hypothetical protein
MSAARIRLDPSETMKHECRGSCPFPIMRGVRTRALGLALIGAAGVKMLLTLLAGVRPEPGPTVIAVAGLVAGLVLVDSRRRDHSREMGPRAKHPGPESGPPRTIRPDFHHSQRDGHHGRS